jgi:hypothetical protein
MKKLLIISFFAVATHVLYAHPGLDPHAHDSIVGEWGWLAVALLVLFAGLRFFNRRQPMAK